MRCEILVLHNLLCYFLHDRMQRTLEKEVRPCGALIIWTDCDREGENIGFEIIQVCLAIKPNLRVYRSVTRYS